MKVEKAVKELNNQIVNRAKRVHGNKLLRVVISPISHDESFQRAGRVSVVRKGIEGFLRDSIKNNGEKFIIKTHNAFTSYYKVDLKKEVVENCSAEEIKNWMEKVN